MDRAIQVLAQDLPVELLIVCLHRVSLHNGLSVAILEASMWQRVDIYIHVYLRPSTSAELRNIREKNKSERDLTTIRYYRKRQNQTFPDPVPMPTHLPDIAEHTGRYSVGSHNTS
jgi:hypothetical protein